MALLIDQLTVWEIGFRWAGYDPDKFYYRIPLPVRDNFRLILNQIRTAHLQCITLLMDKYVGDDPETAQFYIRYWMDPIDECIAGRMYSPELLKFALIHRSDFQEWCARHKVPLPEFWFPTGWGIDYEWPDDEEDDEVLLGESIKQHKVRIDDRHRIEMACKQIALSLWEKDPLKNIKDIANSNEVQKLGGGENYELETVLEWLGKIDPRDPSKKRGPKRKNNTGSENPDQT